MKYFVYIIFIVLLLPGTSIRCYAQDENSLYAEAIEYYSNNNFDEALTSFEKLIANEYSSFPLFYNTANAYFKNGNIPASILYYEKALLIKPFNEDARYNLEIARTFTVDKLKIIPEVFFVRWVKIFSLVISTNSWAILSLVSFMLFIFMLAAFLFSSRFRFKKLSFSISIIMFIISLLSLSFSLTNRSMTSSDGEAIIFEPIITGKSSPGTGGKDLFVIHEGTKVSIEDTIGEWYEIKLSDGTKGWISREFVEKI